MTWKEIEEKIAFDINICCYGDDCDDYTKHEKEVLAFFKAKLKEAMEEMAQSKKEFFMGGSDIPRVEGYNMFRQEMQDKIKEFFGE